MFGLEPQVLVERVRALGAAARVPSLAESVWRGAIGFTLVSLAGFAPWVLAGGWFYRHLGEAGLYVVCAIAFIGFSGLLLHKLIIGPGTLVRFYKVFSLAFAAYAVAWTLGWMALRGHAGSIAGLLAGAAVMGAILAHAFGTRFAMLAVILVLFAANALGYFIGGWFYEWIGAQRELAPFGVTLDRTARGALARAAWGLFYGLGFGAGIGATFYLCQANARRLLASAPPGAQSSIQPDGAIEPPRE